MVGLPYQRDAGVRRSGRGVGIFRLEGAGLRSIEHLDGKQRYELPILEKRGLIDLATLRAWLAKKERARGSSEPGRPSKRVKGSAPPKGGVCGPWRYMFRGP